MTTMIGRAEQLIQSCIEYDSESGSYLMEPDSGDSIGTNLVLCIATIEDVRPTQLPPLAHVIDPDALEKIFSEAQNATLSFSYAGYDIFLHSDSTVEVVPLDGREPVHQH